ncbi:hypothetical protein [Streptomyces sp. NPDC001985]|uniref:hypothetical protein n=1 Tax=Streptomyces sp. NPDC001985 TaxID=3154406 RepID=UPI0033212A4E
MSEADLTAGGPEPARLVRAADFPPCECPNPDCPEKITPPPDAEGDSPLLAALRSDVRARNRERRIYGDWGRT